MAAAIGLLALTGCSAAYVKAHYGEKVTFAKGSPITFADFTAAYLGEKTQPAPGGRMMSSHEFEIDDGEAKKRVSWSSGMGDISPSHFKAAGKDWLLELRISDKLGKLQDNEMVVSAAR